MLTGFVQYRGMESVLIELPAPTLNALHRIARQDDIPVVQVLRDAILRDLHDREKAQAAANTNRPDLPSLKALVADDFTYSRSWAELQSRLADKGYILQETDGRVCLHNLPANLRICKISDLGFSHVDLMRKFRQPFLQHSHRWLYERNAHGVVAQR